MLQKTNQLLTSALSLPKKTFTQLQKQVVPTPPLLVQKNSTDMALQEN